jgi:hypothetical protein
MAALLVENTVADFESWLPKFESMAPYRESHGIGPAILWQDSADPNHIFVLLKHPDLEALRRFTEDPRTAENMRAAGVVSKPVFRFLGDARKYEH